jgi:hypothetical protein
VASPGNPQSLDRYGYVYNNPIVFVDPGGQIPFGECGASLEECGALGFSLDDGTLSYLSEPSYIWYSLPVKEPTELQWYGNTQYAYEHGDRHNYDDFAQGLHPGIDLVAPSNTPIYAGTYGFVGYSSGIGYEPGRLEIRFSDSATVLYGHVADIRVEPGQQVVPTTIVGYIDIEQEHLHIEIIQSDSDGLYMTNPLPYFRLEDQLLLIDIAESIEETDNRITFFRPSAGYATWQDPYRQPDLRRSADPIVFPP